MRTSDLVLFSKNIKVKKNNKNEEIRIQYSILRVFIIIICKVNIR